MAEWDDEELEYDLLNANILDRLKDRTYFINAVIHNYMLTGHSVGLQPMCSVMRVGSAYDYWQSDIKRTLTDGIEPTTTALDHFKHASFIAFWLRRMIPINELRVISPKGSYTEEDHYDKRVRFIQYGNELAAFLIGYKLCLNYEMGRTQIAVGKQLDVARSLAVPTGILDDFIRILKHKNMSPYALYMMYKSLFVKRD